MSLLFNVFSSIKCVFIFGTSLFYIFSGFYSCVRAFIRFVCLLLADFIYHSLSTRSLTSTVKYLVLLSVDDKSREDTVLLHLHTLLTDILSPHKSSIYKALFVNYRNQSQIWMRVSSCQHIYMKHKKPTDSDLAEKYNVPVHCRMTPVVAPKLKI